MRNSGTDKVMRIRRMILDGMLSEMMRIRRMILDGMLSEMSKKQGCGFSFITIIFLALFSLKFFNPGSGSRGKMNADPDPPRPW